MRDSTGYPWNSSGVEAQEPAMRRRAVDKAVEQVAEQTVSVKALSPGVP